MRLLLYALRKFSIFTLLCKISKNKE